MEATKNINDKDNQSHQNIRRDNQVESSSRDINRRYIIENFVPKN